VIGDAGMTGVYDCNNNYVRYRDVKDGTMLKLKDIDVSTPSSVRRARINHLSSINSDAMYYSEPEFDIETSSRKSP